jgi:DNA-binding SARP family transcriptional activator/tetratricopeptide (TPR) repeat protein
LRFNLLGPLEIRRRDGGVVRLPAGRARTVLALLSLRAGQVATRDWLIEAAWNGASPASSVTRLHGFISELRKALPPEAGAVILTRAGGYLLDVTGDEIDLFQVRDLMSRARSHRERGEVAAAAGTMAQALRLWRGTPFHDSECAELRAEADLIEQVRADGLEEFAELELELGHHAALGSGLSEWTARYPLREGLVGCLMRALAGSGRQAEAIAAYHDLRRRLADELGVDPAPPLQEIYRSILDGDQELLTPVSSPSPVVPLPAQLPADTPDFTGRTRPVERVRAALVAGLRWPGAVPVCAISGAAGVGKSTLAVHVAHLVADAFPDGTLYVDLAGTSGEPLPPGSVLARLLRDLGAVEDDLPADEAERVARYRSLLAGRKVLLLLDDARDAAQVRPLLPGSAGSAVLVTSRSGLADLDGAHHADLDVLPEDEGRKLFRLIVGASRADADHEATGRLLRSCAGLPLAIRVAGAKLAARPHWTVADVADRLAAEHRRLAELQVGDIAVRASFQLSYNTLDAEHARAFLMLGIAWSPVFSAGRAAALCDVSFDRAEQLLDGLTDIHILESPAIGVYRMHDLLWLFAREIADASVPRRDRDRAIERLIGWYALALREAAGALAQGRRMPPTTDPPSEPPAAGVPDFGSFKAALGWCEAEYPSLVRAISEAARLRQHAHAVNMACWMWMYATRTVAPTDYVSSQRIGLECAVALKAEQAQAWLLTGLGWALDQAGDFEQSADSYQQSLDLRLRLGDEPGVAATRNNIAMVYFHQNRYSDAVEHCLAAAAIAWDAGHKGLSAGTLMNAADCYRQMGAYGEALDAYQRALATLIEEGTLYDVADCRTGLGETLRLLGRTEESLAEHELAVAVHRDLGTTEHNFRSALDLRAKAYASAGRIPAPDATLFPAP